ncbi:MAG: hypothetical protein IJA97_00570 [Clostridia bacterium]|nr:hypothetical protein [Clostridia bacterium]
MKKIIAILTLVVSILALASCKNTVNLEMYLSEIRHSVYKYECEDYTVTVYAEEKETPYLNDGYVGEMKKYVTVRIEDYKSSLSDASVSLSYGDTTVFGKFEYSPINGKFITEIEVDDLPTQSSISAVVKNAGEEKGFEISKFTLSGSISYKSALDKVAYAEQKSIEKMLSGSGSSIEARVRVLTEGESVYYYVSISDKNGKTVAYLVDGVSGEILASKTT